MRIISGKFARRKLKTNPGLVTRPITDRVKERLFENTSQRITGKRIADIFAGTGTIGLEALSRGAAAVTFIEKDRVAVDLMKDNISTIGCEDETLVWPADVLRCSFKPKGDRVSIFCPWDVIFFDPPYKMVEGIVPGKPLYASVERLAKPDVSASDATLVIRTPKHAKFELPNQWTPVWTMEMSGMRIDVCDKVPEESTEP